jgi:hypothetical protein
MKNLFAALFVVAALASCGGEKKAEENHSNETTTPESTMAPADSNTATMAPADSVKKDTAAHAGAH